MKFDELIVSCIECIQTYNQNKEGPDSHAENYLKNKTKDSHERMFIKQILYGILRYSDFLKVFTENLFTLNKSSTERKDETLYQIFTYITVFRLDELPLDDYKLIILSQDYVKMNEFFKFLFNPDVLTSILRPEWIKLYDMTFVDEKLIGGLQKNVELLSDLLTTVMNKAQAGNINKSEDKSLVDFTQKSAPNFAKNKKLTVPEPFNLTKTKPKIIQPPIKIEHKFETKPIPYDEYQKVSLDKMEAERKQRLGIIKDQVFKKYESTKQFDFETAKRPTNLEKISEEVEKKIKSELQFDKKYCNPPKDFTKAPADVKYNETAILREEFLIQKKKKKEEEELNNILINKKDDKEYTRWKKESEEKENLLKQEEIQKRKLELELNREVAMDYYNQRILQNKLLVAKHKEEEQIKMSEKKDELMKELEEKRKLVKEIDKERENIIEEKEKIAQKNREIYEKQLSEFKDMMIKLKEEKRIEEEKRKDIIRQIRELEKLPFKRTKGFDPTETPGHGLLEEMSLTELKERLEIQKKFYQEYTEAKKEENKLKFEEKTENLIEKAKVIAEHRDKLRNEKEIERRNKKEQKEQEEQIKKEIREKSLLEVRGKIDNKKKKLKKEEEEFQKKIREIRLQRQYLQQGRAVVEEKAFKQIEDGLERKINDKQNKDLIDQQAKESVKYGEIKIRFNSAKNEVDDKLNLINTYDKNFNILKSINDNCNKEDGLFKKTVHDREYKVAGIQKTKIKERNKYSDALQEATKNQNSMRTTKTKTVRNVTANNNKNIHNINTRSLSPNSIGSRENENDPILDKLNKEMV